MIIVSKFPVRVIDELLDELSGPNGFLKWTSGQDITKYAWHLVRSTNSISNSFRALGIYSYAFGLAGAPATFLGAMDATRNHCYANFSSCSSKTYLCTAIVFRSMYHICLKYFSCYDETNGW